MVQSIPPNVLPSHFSGITSSFKEDDLQVLRDQLYQDLAHYQGGMSLLSPDKVEQMLQKINTDIQNIEALGAGSCPQNIKDLYNTLKFEWTQGEPQWGGKW